MPDTNEKMKFRYNNKEQRNIKMNTFLTMGFAVLKSDHPGNSIRSS